ncbi:MAG: hypothetical protein [Caudoviricetes sp.]|nr:MAG: hypothetical protein [Caudoviricetes sp.]
MKNLAYYRVTINNTASNSSPADGFVDFNNVSNYIQIDQVNGIYENLPSSLEKSLAKTRGYIRYQKIVDNLNFTLNTLGIIDMIAQGADVNTEATSISFTVVYDKPWYLQTIDPVTNKTVTGELAIKSWIAQALNQNLNLNYMIFDPTLSINPNVMKGYLLEKISVGAYGAIAANENAITVTQIDGTQNN